MNLRLLLSSITLLVLSNTNAQVGIGNTNPLSTLDISASSVTSPTNNDGILIPRVSNFPSANPTASQDGMLIFYTGTSASGKGFYYWNQGTGWVFLSSGGKNTLDQAYDEGGAGAGKTIIADNGAITINGEDGLLITGTYGSGETIIATNPLTRTRMFYNPRKAAFRAGFVSTVGWDDANVGSYSTAFGFNTWASGDYSLASGASAFASGNASTAIGFGTTASGNNSTAFGRNSTASGDNSTAFGYDTTASGEYSTAFGRSTEASGNNSTAFGRSTEASGDYTIAFGYNTSAFGNYSTAFGFGTDATGEYATAFGRNSTASGDDSTTFGFGTDAAGRYATVFGRSTEAPSYAETTIGIYSTSYTPLSITTFNINDRLFSIGNGNNSSSRSNALTIYKNGLMNINDEYNMPLTDGSNGQVMTSDGSGNITFQNVNNTDNQTIDTFNFNNTTNLLTLAIETDGLPNQVVDLSSLANDEQTIDTFSFNTSNNRLTLEIENDGLPAQIVDLSSLASLDTDWTEVGTDIERQSGDVYIGNFAGTNNNIYVSNNMIDWDNPNYFINPDENNKLDELELDDGSVTDPSLYFAGDTNFGFSYNDLNNEIHLSDNNAIALALRKDGGIVPVNGIKIGLNAGINNTSNDAVFIGTLAGLNNTIGTRNIGIGSNALRSITTIENNVAIGHSAMELFTGTFGNNIAIGNRALANITEGANNTALGNSALANVNYNTTGNVAIGNGALGAMISGNRNTAVGASAGASSTGADNIFIGYSAGFNATGSNLLYIENSSSNRPLIYGTFDTDEVGINWNAATALPNTLSVNGNASKATAGNWLANSDIRLKKNIETIESNAALNQILSLRGVTYEWNDEQTGINRPTGIQYGFIAQEIMDVFPKKVTMDNLGYYQTAYGDYDALFVQSIKALNDKINKLEAENKLLKELINKISQLETKLESIENKSNNTISSVSLATNK